MTLTSIGSLTQAQQTADAQAAAAQSGAGPSPEQLKAAKDFEAIFIRQLLSSLEKSSGLSGGDQSGGAVFRSMMVNALADTASEGGGIGLRDLITRAMLPQAPQGKPHLGQAATGAGAALAVPPPTGAFQSEALGALTEPALGQSLEPRVSERLGAPSHILTRARSSPMLMPDAAVGETPPTRPEGNR